MTYQSRAASFSRCMSAQQPTSLIGNHCDLRRSAPETERLVTR
jgi:hypothetical protein